jgi:hypothetical protein
LRRLGALVDSLRREVDRLRAQGNEPQAQDALAALRAAASAAADAAGAPEVPTGAQSDPDFSGRSRSLQALNPEISVTGDVFAHVARDATATDNFFAREFEIAMVSNLDPYSRAKIFVGRHVPGGEIVPFGDHDHGGEASADAHGGSFEVEEGYVEWVGMPGGTGVKLGRFYQQFGQVNRWHSHAFPFQSRPLPHLAFFGEEGLGQSGVSVRSAPYGAGPVTLDGTVEVTRSENEALFGASARPSVLGHLNSFWQLSRASDLDLGVSWLHGRYQAGDDAAWLDRNVFNTEMSFTWHPPERAKYRGFNLRAGLMVLEGLVHHEEGEAHDEDSHEEADRALGFWSWAEVRLSQSWLAGARYEWVENPEDPEETSMLFSPSLTWWQSEYVRVRGEYDVLGRKGDPREGRFVLQVTFSMGPHKHEIY